MSQERFWWYLFIVAQVPAVLLFRAAVLPPVEQQVVAVGIFMAAQLVLAGCIGAGAQQGWDCPIAWLVPLGTPLMLVLGTSDAVVALAGTAYYLDLASHALLPRPVIIRTNSTAITPSEGMSHEVRKNNPGRLPARDAGAPSVRHPH